MSEHKRAKVYALDKVGPMNLGAGTGTDYIYKAFGRTVEGHDVGVTVNAAEFEGHVKALLNGQSAEVICDPSRVIVLKLNVAAIPDAAQEAIAATRAKTIAGRQQEPDRRQPGT